MCHPTVCKSVRFGVAVGLTWGLGVFILGIMATYWGIGVPMVTVMGSLYLGFAASVMGSVKGFVWGFIDGFLLGFFIKLFYRLFKCPACGAKCDNKACH